MNLSLPKKSVLGNVEDKSDILLAGMDNSIELADIQEEKWQKARD